jgi:3-oxoacyl-[acyl-carrier protein] reductase
MNIKGASILITGGGRGIGYFLAANLLKIAHKVVVIDKDAKALESIDKNSGVFCYSCDLTDHEAVAKVITEIYTEHPDINVLINNAGLIHSEPLFNMLKRDSPKHSIENWKRTIDVNLNAVFYTTVNVVERMCSKRIKNGVIINISSISAQGNAGQSAYSAAKAGVEAMAKTWSKELGMFKIRCAAIAPGFFNTQSTKTSLSENVLGKWEQAVPLKRLGELDEILLGVKFIIENDYFNGRLLSIDGGLTI